jgi:4-alpha-glucanotransferase
VAIDYLDENKIPEGKLSVRFVSLIMQSKADLCIVPMQDWLELDDRARMNTPSVVGENWKWRMDKSALTDELCTEIRELTKKYGR